MTTFPELPAIDKALSLIEEIGEISRSDLRWEFKRLRSYRDALFEHFAPFKAGDAVVLKRDLDLSRSPGWKGYEKMMSKGATAVVQSVDWYDGSWTIYVIFDHEFRWDYSAKGYREYTENKSLFCFRQADSKWAKVENITGMRLPG